MSDEPRTIIAKFGKNKSDDLVVALFKYQGHDLCDIRTYSVFGEGDDRKPTKKGVSFRVALLPELIGGLQLAEAEARRRGLMGGDA